MRLSLLATSTVALSGAAALGTKEQDIGNDRLIGSFRNGNNNSNNKKFGRILEDIRTRILKSDGTLPYLENHLQSKSRTQQEHQALWKSVAHPNTEEQERSVYDYHHDDRSNKDNTQDHSYAEPDVGILSNRKLDEFESFTFCDMFLQVGAFGEMICDCQNNPRAKVSCSSPKVCYKNIDPQVCLSTYVSMVPRLNTDTISLTVCYALREPLKTEYCFHAEIDYGSFFYGNSTIYDSCELSVGGVTCNSCEITSSSQNAQNCTGLTAFDCTNTAAATVGLSNCSLFYEPFPQVTRLDGLSGVLDSSDGGNRWSAGSFGSLLLLGVALIGAMV